MVPPGGIDLQIKPSREGQGCGHRLGDTYRLLSGRGSRHGTPLDGILSVRERAARGDFALHALLGIDFLINPRWIIGADARGFWVATNAKSPLSAFIVTAALRVGVRFDLR